MQFDHERLDVYKMSLKFAKLATELINTFPPGSSHLSDQLKRAFVSISLNIAEGAGEYSRSEKGRFYRMSRRSATECAAIVDICKELELGNSALWTKSRMTLKFNCVHACQADQVDERERIWAGARAGAPATLGTAGACKFSRSENDAALSLNLPYSLPWSFLDKMA